MTTKKKSLLAVAFVVWVLGAIFLACKTFDYYSSRNDSERGEDALTLERLMFPSRMARDHE